VRIVEVRAIPLRGRVSEGGWEETLDPEDNSHTLVQVVTDQGVTGVGSAYTSLALVEALRSRGS
jgi:D-galactarolactone cycloisomerase